MSLFILTNIIVLILIGFLLLILSWIWPPDSPWAPWWSTNRRTARIMCKLAKVSKKDTVYELGSGNATALIIAAKEFGAKGVGIEIDPLRVSVSKLMISRNKLQNQVEIKKKNFFDVDISSATVIFVYLVPKALERLKPKFLKELKPGTRIVSYRYKISLPLVAEDLENEIRVYKI